MAQHVDAPSEICLRMNLNRYRIGNTYITATNPDDAENCITKAALDGENGIVCISNMRTLVFANKHEKYRNLMNDAFMCTPDGTPLVWMARLWGLKEVKRTNGPDLFLSMLSKPESGITHFFLGDTDETLAAIKAKYPDAAIVGSYSPPFCGLDEYDYEAIARRVNESGANVVWISLRAPKQDFFSARLLPFLDGKMCIGVGAAFRFATGEIRHPSRLIQKLGLTGLVWRKNKIETLWNTFVRSLYLCRYSAEILWARFIKKGI